MCVGSSPKTPDPPPQLPEAPRAPGNKRKSKGEDRRRRTPSAGGTILTGGQGVLESASVQTKTLLGS